MHDGTVPLGMKRFILLVALLSVAHVTHAAAVRVGGSGVFDKPSDGDSYIISLKHVGVTATTTGDLIMVAQPIVSTGHVFEDATLVSGEAELGGIVDGDVRILSGIARIRGADIGEDLIVVGGTVEIATGTHVHGDLIVFAEYLKCDGEVDGNVEAHVRSASVTGRIGGAATIRAGESLVLGDTAQIDGALSYSAPRQALVGEHARVHGSTTYAASDFSGVGYVWPSTLILLFQFFVASVASTLLLLAFPDLARATALRIADARGFTAVKGVVAIMALPVLSVVLLVTIVGAIPGLVVLLLYGVLACVSFAYTPIVAGIICARMLKREPRLLWVWSMLGAVVLTALSFLPFIGWIIRLLVFILAFGVLSGALLSQFRQWMKRQGR